MITKSNSFIKLSISLLLGSCLLDISAYSQNVGIGTASPSSKLHIFSTANTYSTIDAGSAKQAGINMAIAGITRSNVYYDNNTSTYGSNGALLINDVGAGSPYTLINPTNGSIGIGLGSGTVPSQVLDAAGTPRFRGLSAGVVTSSSTGVLGSLAGTSTTVLHGNASGIPTYGAVALGTDVSGTLGLVNGGTGANLSATGGTGQYLKQSTVGGAISVGTIAAADIPAGSGNYIQNTSTQQSSSNFNISGTGTVGTAINIGSTGSTFSNDQGGSLEVGAGNSAANTSGAVPYIDFHYGVGSVQDFNVRVINDANGVLDIIGTEKVSTLAGTGTRPVMADATGILRSNNKSSTNTASWTAATAGTSWVVPAGVYEINVLAIGGGGGTYAYCCSNNCGGGGGGGAVMGKLAVTPGETLTMVVGSAGGAGGSGTGTTGGGGGSAIKRSSTILCAGGGGAGGSYNSSNDWGGPGGTAFGTSINASNGTTGSGNAAGGNNNIDYLYSPISYIGGSAGTGGSYNYIQPQVSTLTGINGSGNYGRGGRNCSQDAGTSGAIFINY